MSIMSVESYLNDTYHLNIKNHFILFQSDFNIYLKNNYEDSIFFFIIFLTLFSLKIDGHLNDNKRVFLNQFAK